LYSQWYWVSRDGAENDDKGNCQILMVIHCVRSLFITFNFKAIILMSKIENESASCRPIKRIIVYIIANEKLRNSATTVPHSLQRVFLIFQMETVIWSLNDDKDDGHRKTKTIFRNKVDTFWTSVGRKPLYTYFHRVPRTTRNGRWKVY